MPAPMAAIDCTSKALEAPPFSAAKAEVDARVVSAAEARASFVLNIFDDLLDAVRGSTVRARGYRLLGLTASAIFGNRRRIWAILPRGSIGLNLPLATRMPDRPGSRQSQIRDSRATPAKSQCASCSVASPM